MEAAAARRTRRTKKGLDPRTLLVFVVVSVSVVVTRMRVCVVVVVVEAISAAPTPWIVSKAKESKLRRACLPLMLSNRCPFIMDSDR